MFRGAKGFLIHYPNPPHRPGAYRQARWRGGPLTQSERLTREALSLPIGPHLSEIEHRQVLAGVQGFGSTGRLQRDRRRLSPSRETAGFSTIQIRTLPPSA
jgi:hypothetical protein